MLCLSVTNVLNNLSPARECLCASVIYRLISVLVLFACICWLCGVAEVVHMCYSNLVCLTDMSLSILCRLCVYGMF